MINKEPLTLQDIEREVPTESLIQELNDMEVLGLLIKNKDNLYTTLEREELIHGVVRLHEKGYGFVKPTYGDSDDFYVTQQDLKGALNGSTVLIKLKKQKKSQSTEAKVARVLSYNFVEFVGTFFKQGSIAFVKPDDKKMPINPSISTEHQMGAVDGHKVLVEITNYNPDTQIAEGKIKEVLGHKNDPGVDILSVIYNHGINIEFSPESLEQAANISDTITTDDVKNRTDLRDKTIVTIDGEDAKDLDDAVQVEKLADGTFVLGVHIADVSHYVTKNSPLDLEAYDRGTSVYLVDRVIPMIPHRLSNGICSLNPQVDRLTLTCEMHFDNNGDLLDYKLFESVINTAERMTYTDVRKILLKEDAETETRYKHLVPTFHLMAELSQILRKKRNGNGSIDFDVKEGKVLLDDEGKTTEIVFRERTVAEKLIEDFMLAANETVASHFNNAKIPFVYRIHDKPHESRLFHFIDFIATLGYRIERENNTVDSKQIQKLLEKTKGREEDSVISRLALRSMQQARYTPENVGHYGLAMENYTHFTSPIRRYPDLLVHRLIKKYIGEQSNETDDFTLDKLIEITEHSSSRERRAVLAERDTLELKKAEFMFDKIGEEFEGMISSVTKFGFFVELDNTIEGLVHIKSLADDHYIFEEKKLCLVGKKTKRQFTIGDKLKVKLVDVDVNEHRIDFEVVKNRNSVFNPKKTTSKRKSRFNNLYN